MSISLSSSEDGEELADKYSKATMQYYKAFEKYNSALVKQDKSYDGEAATPIMSKICRLC